MDTESILTSKETLFIIQDIRHVHHLAPTLFVLHLQTDEILILLTEVAVLVLILNILRRLFTNSSFISYSNPLSEIYLYCWRESVMLTQSLNVKH